MRRTIEIDEGALAGMDPADAARTRALLAELRRQIRENPLEGYNPFDHQHDIHSSRHKIRALFGGNRAGKTTCGVVDDLFEVTPVELMPEHLLEYKRSEWVCPRYVRCCAPSTRLLNRVFIPKFIEMTPKVLLKGGGWGNSFNRQDGILQLECGCRIDFMTYEMDLDKFGGSALHRIHYDEEPPEDIREECRTRTIDFNGTELFTMTPLQGMTWMYDDIWLRAEYEENRGKIYARSAAMTDNRALPKEAVEDIMDEWAGDEQYEARIEGRFVHFGGMVYPTFDETIGDAPTPEWVQSMDIVCGIDPGIAGGAAVWVAFDLNNDAVVFAERFFKDEDVAEIAAAIDAVNEAWGLRSRRRPGHDVSFVIDPMARSRDITRGVTIESEFNTHGIYPAWGQNDREAGCFMIRRRIRQGQLSVSNELRRVPWEAKRYRVEPREDGKWDVVKENDHAMDAMRYAIMHRPWLSEPNVRPLDPGPDFARGPNRRRTRVSSLGE